MNRWLALVVLFLPSSAKVALLRFFGHKVHETTYIGFSYLHVKHIFLAEETYIGHGNIFTNLDHLELRTGARINRWNRFTSGPGYVGTLVIGERSSISLRHYFDVCALIQVGHDTTIAGHHSTFFTHSKGIETLNYVKPILVGDWCYLGSNLNVAPGVKIGDYCFVGMGAVLSGDYQRESYALLAGNPASVKKRLSSSAAYFAQGQVHQPHMRKDRKSTGTYENPPG